MDCEKKCMRGGRITNNGYLNFLREFRKIKCGMSAVETVCAGARAWNRLTRKQKKKYIDMGKKKRRRKRGACGARRKPKKRRCAPKRKRRARSRKRCPRPRPKPRRRSRCPSKRKRCMRPGPVTSNPFLNYLRVFKKRNCGLKPQELVKRAAKCWCKLPEGRKRRYHRMACKLARSCRKRNSKLCRSFRKRRR